MEFQEALEKFVKEAQALVDDYWMGYVNNPHMMQLKPTIKATEGGKRYIRIISESSQTSVYCFIDTTNGDVLKGSWKAPVKNGVRGNIFKGSAGDYMTKYGPKYLR